MPVSSPSYFPPQGGQGQIVGTTAGIGATGVRTFLAGQNAAQWTQPNDLIVVGDHALSAGTSAAPITDANLAGTLVMGSQAAAALTSGTGQGGIAQSGPNTVIGFNAMQTAINANGNTVIGSNALAQYNNPATLVPFGANVFIGENVGKNLVPGFGLNNTIESVVIGYQAASAATSAAGFVDITQAVVIGWKACAAFNNAGVGGTGIDRCVVIGAIASAGPGRNNNDNVMIGFQAGVASVIGTTRNVYIGTGVISGTAAADTDNVAIGSSNNANGVVAGTAFNVVVGALSANAGGNSGCVLLGAGCGNAGATAIAAGNNQFLLEINGAAPASGTRNTLLYGLISNVSPGGLIIGHSTPGTNRDIPGFNVLKLLAGTVTGVAPVGGGMFYVTTADNALHYVNSGNVDTALGSSGPVFYATGLGVITPAAIAANTNDYAPAGFANAQVARISATAAFNLTGLAGGAAGREVTLVNIGANNITLTHQDPASLAANRFSLPGAANLVLTQNSSVLLWFDTTTGNWRSIAR